MFYPESISCMDKRVGGAGELHCLIPCHTQANYMPAELSEQLMSFHPKWEICVSSLLWSCGEKQLGKSSKGQGCVAFIPLLHNTLCEHLKHQVKTYLEFNDAIAPFRSKLQESLITSLRGQAIQLTSKGRLEKIITVNKWIETIMQTSPVSKSCKP